MIKLIFLFAFLAKLSTVLSSNDLNLPSNIPQRLYCFGCIATISEIEKLLSKRRVTKSNRASKLEEILSKICEPDKFMSYEYSPPKMTKACKLLIENHEDEVETAFIKNSEKDSKKVAEFICGAEVSRACEGIDTTEKKQPSDNADVELKADASGKRKSQTITIDPSSGKVKKQEEPQKKAKTMSKTDKKKKVKSKKASTKNVKPKKGSTKNVKPKKDVEKGSLHHLNVDINDPSSMERIMEQIKKLSEQGDAPGDKKKKEEL